ncbi:MAG TPA: SAM-dependent methyltransferase [Chthoniobacteraceae bacterium]|nr:SAM-dependent methyltransferase [Chthoniobacteraceae bacterium]
MSALKEEITREGAIPFRRWMERALYDPEGGYYAAGRAAIGREGDFLTSVSIGPLFGRLVAVAFRGMWEQLGRPERFAVVEQGGDGGDFAHDVLCAAEGDGSAEGRRFARALRYVLVEPLALNEIRQRERLARWSGAEGVRWVPTLEALEPWTGVHFSNELLDAMPVHRIVRREGRWREWYVGLEEGDPVWKEGPFSDPRLEAWLPWLPEVEGYETEVNLAALEWVETVAARLERGYLLAADYGFSRADFYLPERTRGTLTAYHRHRRSEAFLDQPGEQDLTAHVEFTSLVEKAEAAGMTLAGFTDQHHWMVDVGRRLFGDATGPLTPEEQRDRRAFVSLMHPGLMGRGFRFLALAKGAPRALPGFAFAGEARGALGLK